MKKIRMKRCRFSAIDKAIWMDYDEWLIEILTRICWAKFV